MGGCQWKVRLDSRRRLQRGRLFVRTTDGDGSPHPRGQGMGKGSFSRGEGSRGGGIKAMGGCQWKVRLDSRRRLHGGRLFVRTTDGDGSPHPRGQGMGKGSFSRGEGSRGGGIKAMGGCQWKVRLDSRRRLQRGRLFARTTEGDGSPHPRGQRMGMGPPIREDNGWGWVPPSARTTDGDGSPHPRGQRMGMGPPIREDNGWGWVPASVRTTDGDGSPHPRGHGMGKGSLSWREGSRGGGIKAMGRCQWKVKLDSRRRLQRGRLFVRTTDGDGSPHPRGRRMGMGPRIREDDGWGWVPASARTTDGDGSPHPRGRRMGMGPRIREDNGGGWVPASARTTDGDGSPHPRGRRRGMGPRIREDKGWGKGVFHGGRVAGEEESRQWADVSGR